MLLFTAELCASITSTNSAPHVSRPHSHIWTFANGHMGRATNSSHLQHTILICTTSRYYWKTTSQYYIPSLLDIRFIHQEQCLFRPQWEYGSLMGLALEGRPWIETDTLKPDLPQGAKVLIKVSHAAINLMDLGLMNIWTPFRRRAVAAVDFAGEIIQAGPGILCAGLQRGTTVCGMLPISQILRGYGTLAEYIVLPSNMVAKKPRLVEFPAAAGSMGIAGQSCVALLYAAKLRQESKVAVNGASGGVGCLLVQVLQAQGHSVIGICSKSNKDMVMRLAAIQVRHPQASRSNKETLKQFWQACGLYGSRFPIRQSLHRLCRCSFWYHFWLCRGSNSL